MELLQLLTLSVSSSSSWSFSFNPLPCFFHFSRIIVAGCLILVNRRTQDVIQVGSEVSRLLVHLLTASSWSAALTSWRTEEGDPSNEQVIVAAILQLQQQERRMNVHGVLWNDSQSL
jgi:hypothetical protein